MHEMCEENDKQGRISKISKRIRAILDLGYIIGGVIALVISLGVIVSLFWVIILLRR
jgi:hypothetical protein